MTTDTYTGWQRRTRCPLDRFAVVILGLSTFVYLPCQSLPTFGQKLPWRNSGLALANPCNSPTGNCLDWIPLSDPRADDYILQEDPEMTRPQVIHPRDIDSAELWRDIPYIPETESKPALPVITPIGNRLEKKDVFMSREWGAGGMPFSVLYMSPRTNHASTSPTAQAEQAKSMDVPRTSESSNRSGQSNYRVAVRNGSSGQPRRQYSIIPQLYISYGWGPTGK